MYFLNRIYRIGKQFFFAKKFFLLPAQVNVLIYDANGAETLTRYIGDVSFSILHVRGESLNLRVILSCILNLEFSFQSYLIRYINFVKPQLVITFTDNSLNFIKLSRYFKDVKFVFIQNGWRGYYQDIFCELDIVSNDFLEEFYVDDMFVFGDGVALEYGKYIKGDIHSIGSMRCNLSPKILEKERGLITYVSQWIPSGFHIEGIFYTFEEYTHQANSMVAKPLIEFAAERVKKIKVLLRNKNTKSDDYELERDYYRQLFGENVEFYEGGEGISPYEVVDRSELVVGIDSTLLYESLARGCKTAVLSIRGDILNLQGFGFGWPANYGQKGFFWCNVASIDCIRKVLEEVDKVDDLTWKKCLEENRVINLITIDYDNLSLKNRLQEILASVRRVD
ncbi:LA_1612 family putative O-antigen biosynthesis protein [Candidatus Methylopumilus universalis]|nr:LA_1612 family putative O-antigen biosynthesis protein [Candidatus Methylopumilus universalis]